MIANDKVLWMDILSDIDYHIKEEMRMLSKKGLIDGLDDTIGFDDLSDIRGNILNLTNSLIYAYPNETDNSDVKNIIK